MNGTTIRVDFAFGSGMDCAIDRVAARRYSPAFGASGDVGEWLKPAVC